MEVGKRIRAVRQQRGMSLRDLARRSGVSKAYLSQLENDPGRKPSVDVVCRIAAALEIPVMELLETGAPPGGTGRGDGLAAATREPVAERAAAGGRPPAGKPGAGRRRPGDPGRPAGAGRAGAAADAPSGPGGTGAPGGSGPPDTGSGDGGVDLESLPWALRVFWQEHPEVTEEEIRSLAAITWLGRRPFTPTDYWVLHQVLSGMTRDR